MILAVINNKFNYELEKLCRIYLPFEKIEVVDTECDADNIAVARLSKGEKDTTLLASLCLDGKRAMHESTVSNDAEDYENLCELTLATQLLYCFYDITGYISPWGILTGVRPAKLFSRLTAENGEDAAEEYFRDTLLVSNKKIELCKKTKKGEEAITSLSKPESFSLYISVPFCPSRCTYCSFVSHSVEHAKKLIPQYVELLCKELRITAEYAKSNGLRLETVYMGGGTPTTLSAEQLKTVLSTVYECFDMSTVRELTVEAGRPDTITEEKLLALKEMGVTRISINPQTMNDSVLKAIGRRHTAREAKDAFLLARKLGFDNINMDLIAGLPSDTYESFNNTLSQIINLNPESVTVHALSMKRAATLSTGNILPDTNVGLDASNMVETAEKILSENKILPYYMYRQSKTVGNLENVGYAKSGYECLYNVYIMDETHTILACGASAVTKLRQPNGNYIERIFNYKYPYEYITRFDELIDRKKRIKEFYETYGELR
ncbi:MAG: coproporphyrinogen dehydrogenase HemZ [Clostridia bacterium]|nr:coproporphyrinogen dehydrogenase HemZ [Clostridia bacterium]